MGKTVVEIERRFRFDADTESKLAAAGASLVSEKSFVDTYVDTNDFCLTGCDHWLRLRDDEWQLKYPSPLQLSTNAAEYVESENEHAILDIISKLIEIEENLNLSEVAVDSSNQNGILSSLDCLYGFCTLKTTRKKYSLNGVVIDLDSADFGFAIGEMEALVVKTGDVDADTQNHRKALQAIDEVASQLGIVFASHRLDGKVTTFMKRYRKDHYDLLVQRGVIKSI